MKRIGVFGGTFNPIHKGHINIALSIAENLMLNKVFVIPNNIPPHKRQFYLLESQTRYKMCYLACKEYPNLIVDDIEITQPGKSYTVTTLEKIKKREAECELFLIIGSDKFMKISKWVGFKKIKKLATICTVPRDFGKMEELIGMENILKGCGAKVEICTPQIIPISSSEIRMKISCGLDVSKMLDARVYRYIQENHLYANEGKRILGLNIDRSVLNA